MTLALFTFETASDLYQSKLEFPVNLDDGWQWLGYSKKENAKASFLSFGFIEGEDYQIVVGKPLEDEQGIYLPSSKTSQGGRPTENLFLTVDCFKFWGMMAKTEQGKQIRKYFLQCEQKLKLLISRHTMPDGIMSITELDAYLRHLQKSGMLLDKHEKAKYATEVSKSFAYRTGTQPIDHTLAQLKVVESEISDHQVLLDKIVEFAKRLNRPISARDVTQGIRAFRKIDNSEIRKIFRELAFAGIGQTTGTFAQIKYMYKEDPTYEKRS